MRYPTSHFIYDCIKTTYLWHHCHWRTLVIISFSKITDTKLTELIISPDVHFIVLNWANKLFAQCLLTSLSSYHIPLRILNIMYTFLACCPCNVFKALIPWNQVLLRYSSWRHVMLTVVVGWYVVIHVSLMINRVSFFLICIVVIQIWILLLNTSRVLCVVQLSN